MFVCVDGQNLIQGGVIGCPDGADGSLFQIRYVIDR